VYVNRFILSAVCICRKEYKRHLLFILNFLEYAFFSRKKYFFLYTQQRVYDGGVCICSVYSMCPVYTILCIYCTYAEKIERYSVCTTHDTAVATVVA